MISGKVLSTEKTTVDFATVYLKGTNYGGTTNEEGIYHLQAPAGEYTLNSYQFDGLIWKTNAYGSSEKSKVTIWRLC